MKGYDLIVGVLAALKAEPVSLSRLSEIVNTGYIPTLHVVRELADAGLVRRVGVAKSHTANYSVALFGFVGGDARIVGRETMQRFLGIWNALQQPSSTYEVGEECGLHFRNVRRIIDKLYCAGFVYRAGWVKNTDGSPTCLFAVGSKRNVPRPKPQTDKQYAKNAWSKKKAARLVGLVSSDPWAVVTQQLRAA